MKLLDSSVRNYSWGSKTMIPQLLGQPAGDNPVAELWFGAHPAAPATLDGTRLDEVIAGDPETHLGQRVRRDHGDRLPFLLKLLAAGEVLSLQAHPSKAQAEEGFARENAQGVALDSSQRNYKDDNHKPELIVALTEFYAMAGFRPLARTRELFAALDCPSLERYLSMLDDDPAAEGASLRALFTTWITIPAGVRKELIADIVTAGERLVAAPAPGTPEWIVRDVRTVLGINEQYPGDIGVLGALLLNHIVLQPGEAVFLAAGQLHAYVHGLGVELMANSDNVLRGGLTPKYVDVPELVKVLDFQAAADPQVHPGNASPAAGCEVFDYPVPIDEFSLRRYALDAGAQATVELGGPAIVLCTRGDGATAGELNLTPGRGAWAPAADGRVRLAAGDGPAEFFVASV
ncbi:mannose-6-phosphate isomerase, class I [Corynebacterium confusum]|uniref:mannose-6-phosphate isomerase, class I n=1 Tax=Corynebacterium confusum TaxID=71254 RepID=UPI0025B57746|nr:mannose-6-phosphate isomerase, class I [Corynebacterium confusum]WJY89189.1 Mannose-6-phosphate isomerase [Corynebacterium confusum]